MNTVDLYNKTAENVLSLSNINLSEEDGEPDLKSSNMDDIYEPFEVSEDVLRTLEDGIELLNKRASKLKVKPLSIKTISTREQEVYKNDTVFGEKLPPVSEVIYKIQVIGENPVIDGYKFLAVIEHTEGGNLIYIAPNTKESEVPTDLRKSSQRCDVCNVNRHRNKTFIMRMEKSDDERFPNKTKGDIFVVGSNCIKKFFPSADYVAQLIGYVKYLEMFKDTLDQSLDISGGDREESERGSMSNSISSNSFFKWLCRFYIMDGRYLSSKKFSQEQEDGKNPSHATIDMLKGYMYNSEDAISYVSQKIQSINNFDEKTDKLYDEFEKWNNSVDFDELSEKNPNFSGFYHNLSVISKLSSINLSKQANLAGALFQLFIRKYNEKNTPKPNLNLTYIGEVGDKVNLEVTLVNHKQFESQYGTVHLYNFEDEKKNKIVWWASRNQDLEDGEKVNLSGRVKKHEENKYSKLPQTVVTRAKIKKL